MRLFSRRSAGTAAVAAVLLASVATAANAATTPSTRFTVPHTQPEWAKSSRVHGGPKSSAKVSFSVALPLRNAAEAARVADSVADPASPSYGHYLTPSEFNARYSPSASQVQKIKSYLGGQGFIVGSVADGNRWISATGTVAQINRAFATTLRNYSYKGKTLRAPDRPVTLPSSLRGLVLGISGLDNGGLLRTSGNRDVRTPGAVQPVASKSAGRPNASPAVTGTCSTYWGQQIQSVPTAYGLTSFPTYICGYTPAQIRSAYGVPAGRTGAGVTVAIIDAYATSTMLADANKYSTAMGEPKFATGQYKEKVFKPFTLTGPNECNQAGWAGEEALDVEAVHGMAPKANILYVGAQNCDTGLDDAINWVIQNHAASIVSNSWGATGEEGLGSSYNLEKSLFLQAKAQGIGFYFSSGDNGDNATPPTNYSAIPEPDYPSSDANVTAVGGTSLAISSAKGYQWETSWGSYIDPIVSGHYSETLPGEFWGGAGGGASTLTPQPSYQIGVVPDSLSKLNGSTAMRVVPDVAALADPFTGYAVGLTSGGTFAMDTYGGTSLACPLFAAVQALAQQGRGVAIGFANPLLYRAPASSFHDVVAPANTVAVATPGGGTLVTFASDTSLQATPGYDDVTGRGSPIVSKLVAAEGSSLHFGGPLPPPVGWNP